MDILTQAIFTLFGTLLIYWLIKVFTRESYWKQLGVYEPKSSWYKKLLVFLQKVHSTDEQVETYWAVPKEHKIYGTYLIGIPVLVIRDPEIIRHCYVKDFDSFVDRSPRAFTRFTDTPTDKVWRFLLLGYPSKC